MLGARHCVYLMPGMHRVIYSDGKPS
eukprot:SAG31_NODE_47946_length_205_cov_17.226415_1_plen_25_part_01